VYCLATVMCVQVLQVFELHFLDPRCSSVYSMYLGLRGSSNSLKFLFLENAAIIR